MREAAAVRRDGGELSDETVAAIVDALRGLRFGEVVISVHDGAVVQVVRSEKLRLPRR